MGQGLGLDAAPPPAMETAFYLALGAYLATTLAASVRLAGARLFLAVGVLIHLSAMAWRGMVIEFFPLTNKFESFSVASLSIALVLLATWSRARSYVLPLAATAIASLLAALSFPHDLRYPAPLMRTIWYTLHVPTAFLSYALWLAAAAAACAWYRTRSASWMERIDRLALQGFALWSFSMVCGGVWGVVAWGAYFMWDPKIIWSVILWFHYASFIHLRLAPSLVHRPSLRSSLAVLGALWILVAYVGTSFFFGRSSHSF